MKCPDCRGQIECDLIEKMADDSNEPMEPYYKCPKCRQEYEWEDEDSR